MAGTMAARLMGIDVVGERRGVEAWARQLAVVAVAVAAVVALGALLKTPPSRVALFALLYPLLMLATFLGRLRSGLLAWAAVFAWAVLVALPHRGASWSLAEARVIVAIHLVSTLMVVLLAEGARLRAAGLIAERDAQIVERDTLLEEVDHRLKNNLAMLTGLMALQIRETTNVEARDVLSRVAMRLESLAKVYDNLRHEPGSVTVINAAVLIEQLCGSLSDALGMDGKVSLECETVPVLISRDRASALALLLNEIVTNAAKHAFVGRERGTVSLRLSRRSVGEALLEVADDGKGMDSASPGAGRGRKLLNALAGMAGGELAVDSDSSGTRYRLLLNDLP